MEISLGQSAEWVGEHDLYAMLADTAALQRDLEALQQYTPQAEETASRFQHRLYQAISLRARGVERHLSGDHQGAETALREALSIFRTFNARWQTARTLLELGRLARQRGERQESTALLAEALDLANRLQAKPLAGIITQLMSEDQAAAPFAG